MSSCRPAPPFLASVASTASSARSLSWAIARSPAAPIAAGLLGVPLCASRTPCARVTSACSAARSSGRRERLASSRTSAGMPSRFPTSSGWPDTRVKRSASDSVSHQALLSAGVPPAGGPSADEPPARCPASDAAPSVGVSAPSSIRPAPAWTRMAARSAPTSAAVRSTCSMRSTTSARTAVRSTCTAATCASGTIGGCTSSTAPSPPTWNPWATARSSASLSARITATARSDASPTARCTADTPATRRRSCSVSRS